MQPEREIPVPTKLFQPSLLAWRARFKATREGSQTPATENRQPRSRRRPTPQR